MASSKTEYRKRRVRRMQVATLTGRLRRGDPTERLRVVRELRLGGEDATDALWEALADEDAAVRAEATAAFAALGASGLEALLRGVRWGDSVRAHRAAQGLRHFGPEGIAAVAALLQPPPRNEQPGSILSWLGELPRRCLLWDPEEHSRINAAQVLGEIGDETAIPPLREALRACLVGGAAWKQLVFGPAFLTGVLLLLVGLIATTGPGRLFGPAFVLLVLAAAYLYLHRRRSRGRLIQAITSALCQIGARRPAVELREVLPELRGISADLLQQDTETRETTRDAVERIESLTEELKRLPLPGQPTTDPAALPRVGEAPSTEAASLPRVR
ncbi:MAG: hypothetical protein ACK47B_02910 [Armatimonadota bacterium]